MATDFTGRKRWSNIGMGIFPVDPNSVAVLSGVPFDRDLRNVVSMRRNPKRHRKYWSLVHFCTKHSSFSREQIDQIFRIRAGHCDVARLADGTIIQTPRSIAFGAMSEPEFIDFLDRVVQVIATDILPGITVQQVHDELAGMIGLERRAA